MFLNGYTTLAAFLSGLRIILGIGLVSVSGRRICGKADVSADAAEYRVALVIALALAVVVLNAVSWPLLYVLLQSYVQQWPSVMCIYGVTQIGKGSIGLSRLLPGLLDILQFLRPLLVFASGAGFVMHLVDRQTATSPLLRRVLTFFLIIGVITVVDASVELSYVSIPRTETRISGGCCTTPLEALERQKLLTPEAAVPQSLRPLVAWSYYALNGGLIAVLFACAIRKPDSDSSLVLSGVPGWILLFAAISSLPVGGLFLRDVAAPEILGLPFHQCPYDLVTAAPESLLAVIASMAGAFSIGWAFLVSRLGVCSQTHEILPTFVTQLLFLSLVSYSASLVLISVELMLC
ncbi:hypothetical protein GC176_02760 [bacterium]|nr:hypothetical protein [bacterium]